MLLTLVHSIAYSASFFDSVDSIGGASPPPVYKAFYDITINFDELQDAPETLTFNLPNGINTTVNLTDFAARQGYRYFDEDEDPPGTPLFWIPEGTPHEEIGYKWAGSNSDYDVLITVYKGILTGIITGNDFRYAMERVTNGNYMMYELDYEFFPPTDDLERTNIKLVEKSINQQNQNETFTSNLKTFDLNRSNQILGSNTTVVDVLIVWTEDARVLAGGAAGNPNDTSDIEALMVASIDHANTAMSNSVMNTRLTKFHTAKYNGFVYSGDFGTDLENLVENVPIQNLRNQVGADTVVAIIGNDFDEFAACGVANVQTALGCSTVAIPGCAPGAAFEEFSYSITTQFCSIWDDTFTHELGHNMGANHVQDELMTSWASGVINNGYPDAFGHRVGGFKSIMSISGDTTARRLNFSNPNVQVNGSNTGILNSAYNARVIDQLTPAMSNFNTRPDIIFINGFE
ncbi:hypothetical protein MNBD_GAMMA02-1811 [hydrothermal vent metagenome]|uniref:Peptidase M12B domain-containing protein n=1 Tax=hydrothermal vent metagenome TaxID=652676 RepID=A0A3B0W1L5_9ZZZZ